MKGFSQHVGKQALVGAILHTIALSSKEGKLSGGEAAPYVILTAEGAPEVSLHPRKAATLFSKGEVDGIKLFVAAVAEEVNAAPAEATPATTPAKEDKTSKKSMAIAIFNEVVAAEGPRAEVIRRFQSEVGLSLNGANTYYQNIRGMHKGWE